jgi:hypothetical protein
MVLGGSIMDYSRMFEFIAYRHNDEREEIYMSGKTKTRLSVQFDNEIYSMLTETARSMGVSNSNLVSMIVGQHLANYQKLLKVFTDPELMLSAIKELKGND